MKFAICVNNEFILNENQNLIIFEANSIEEGYDKIRYIDFCLKIGIPEKYFVERYKLVQIEESKDDKVPVEIYLEEDVLLSLCMIAHEKDITLNELINNILREYVDKYSETKTR